MGVTEGAAAARASHRDAEKMRQILSDPEMREIITDPRTQQLITDLCNNPDKFPQ